MKRQVLVYGSIFICLLLVASSTQAQIRPMDLARDYFVKLVMKDSSQFYGTVLSKPLPDRILFETRYGRLEIPLRDIDNVIDYRYNFVQSEQIRKDALSNTINTEKHKLSNYLNQSRFESESVVYTNDHDIYRGYRYIFDDTAHVILSTQWGELYFTFPQLDKITNYDGSGGTRSVFLTTQYLSVKDPRAWSGYITPNALQIGDGNGAIVDYLVAGLQFNYGVTDWLSLNVGGAFIPFLPNTVRVATGGIKITPTTGKNFNFAIGGQGVYSQVIKETRFLFGYGAVTYGNWESHLSILGGASYKNETDTSGKNYSSQEAILAIEGGHRVGENLKIMGELFFISNFDIVPFVATIRYFENNFTIDIGVVFSLYKSGASRTTPTIAETVFGVQDFPVIPVISGSYHF